MIRLGLRVRLGDAELVLAELLELAPSGVEEIELPVGSGEGEGLVEYAVYGAPGELPLLPDLHAAAGGALVEVSTSEVADDWPERWKRFHRPVLIEAKKAMSPRARGGHCLFVRPPWEPPSDRADALDLVIDPAQAFGTGAHATTRLCLELLLELAATAGTGDPLLDVGSGSGVLAIAALKLGYRDVLALDNDRASVRAISANAAANELELEARRFDLRHERLPWLVGDGEGEGVPLSHCALTDVAVGERVRGRGEGVPLSHCALTDVAVGERVRGRGEGVPLVHSAPTEPTVGQRVSGRVVLANLLRPLLIDLARSMGDSDARAQPRRLELIASGLLREQGDEVAAAFARRLGLSERARRWQGEWCALWLGRS